MIDDEEFAEQVIDIADFPLDAVAARCESFTRLISVASKLDDTDLRKEAMMMLAAVRRSFHTLPAGELVTLPGKQ